MIKPGGNPEIARVFEEIADLMDLRDDNVFKIRAYCRAAQMIGGLEQPLIDLMQIQFE